MIKVLKPAIGLLVRMLSREFLSPEGQAVVLDTFWRRRLRDGDVVEVEVKKPKK